MNCYWQVPLNSLIAPWQEGVDWARSVEFGGSDALRIPSDHVLLSLAFCGDYVCCGAADHTIRIWDRESLQSRATMSGHRGPVTALAAWGKWLISGSTDGSLVAWCVTAGRAVHTWRAAHRDAIRDLATSYGDSDNGLLISVCDRGAVLLWHLGSVAAEPSTWRCVKQLVGHSCSASAVQFLSGDSCLRAATASEDNDVRIWDIDADAFTEPSPDSTDCGSEISDDPAVCVACLDCRSSVCSLAWGDGLLFTASEDRSIRAWAEAGAVSFAIDAAMNLAVTKKWTCVHKLRLSGSELLLRPWRIALCAGRILVSAIGEPPAARRELLVMGPPLPGRSDEADATAGPGNAATGALDTEAVVAAAAAAAAAMGSVAWRLPQAAGATVSVLREGAAGEVWAAVGRHMIVWGRG